MDPEEQLASEYMDMPDMTYDEDIPICNDEEATEEDRKFMRIAYEKAKRSEDDKTQVKYICRV